ncbi:AB hydrolase-1 domain-containing protein [Aphelenchoides besseyi]|nr:AB hydrolase-1 domain-containing protein [Aphelenchoides besseyi]KAI6202411.1 AB hydrolase-1 domain-containing protein [Aphelenchoides besseyi]
MKMGIQEQLTQQLDDVIHNVDQPSTMVQSTTTEIDGRKIFYIYTKPTPDRCCTVILFHDQINDSFVWSEINTLQILAAYGYRSVALDLPLFGRSEGAGFETQEERGTFVQHFLDNIQQSNDEMFVLIGASMAGQYLIPFLNHVADVKQRLIGFVGVALSDSHELNASIRLPSTLIIRGELDSSIGIDASSAFKVFENVRHFVIPRGKHLAHLGNAELFNRVLVNFLNGLMKSP